MIVSDEYEQADSGTSSAGFSSAARPKTCLSEKRRQQTCPIENMEQHYASAAKRHLVYPSAEEHTPTRETLPVPTQCLLKVWASSHIENPYTQRDEHEKLNNLLNLTLGAKLEQWLWNNRRRYIRVPKPEELHLLPDELSNGEPTRRSGGGKKQKQPHILNITEREVKKDLTSKNLWL